ncbi:PaaI family thioesterase [bacterium]|nr:PaaI family thioesterase [bacterium]
MKEFPKSSKGFHPFGELIGLEFTELGDGSSICRIEICKKLLNPHGATHGGVIYSMIDTGMGGALYSKLNPSELCATVEIKVHYFKAVFSGTLECITRLIQKGKRIATLESDVFHEGKLVAKALGTYSIFPLKQPE